MFAGDFAYDPDEDAYVACRNYGAAMSGLPTVSEAVQTVVAPSQKLFEVGAPEDVWSLYSTRQRRIAAIHTSIEDLNDMSRAGGYKRIYNACVATDVYGYTLSSQSIDVYFTSSAVSGDEGLTGDAYMFTPMIHEFTVERWTL